jgi:ABC-type sugar transport system ATPase subunit
MDEPTAVLGVPEQLKVIALIHSLKAAGKGVIFISHNLRDIFEVADRVVVFRRGENAGECKPNGTTSDEIVRDGGKVKDCRFVPDQRRDRHWCDSELPRKRFPQESK